MIAHGWKPPRLRPIRMCPIFHQLRRCWRWLALANHGSKAWIWEQYDHMVLADTAIRPGSDAGVVRVHGTEKALAFTSDVNPRFCFANPVEGGKQAVAEAIPQPMCDRGQAFGHN